jgi:putative thiamine transport system permease protein
LFRGLTAGLIGLTWGLPLAFSLAFSLPPAGDAEAWRSLFAHPQLAGALTLALGTGSAALVLSLTLALVIIAGSYGTRSWMRLARASAAFLAVPHLAFTIGLVFLLLPSGVLARLMAQAITGWQVPPDWVLSQDPHGISLTAALVLKETPFLVWSIWAQLARGDTAQAFEQQWRMARSLGHGPLSVWCRVLVPQILHRLRWPLAVVWIYGASVVDMALVNGPTQPPTLAVIAWADLNDAELAINARGSAAALLLAGVLLMIAMAVPALVHLLRPILDRFMTSGPARGGRAVLAAAATICRAGFVLIYGAVFAVLVLMSFSARWPFPDLVPTLFHLKAWGQMLAAPEVLLNSLWLALASMAAAMLLALMWLEAFPQRFDRWLAGAAILAVLVPQITLVGGQYALFLQLGLAGSMAGVYLGHLVPVFAYVLIVLIGPYRAFDSRFRSVSFGLNCSGWRFWLQVKRPLMQPALAAAAAVGFAVSLVQYLPSQLLGAGRVMTLPVAAVTLASGGNRPLLAAYALGLTLPAALGFLLAQRLSHVRWTAA